MNYAFMSEELIPESQRSHDERPGKSAYNGNGGYAS